MGKRRPVQVEPDFSASQIVREKELLRVKIKVPINLVPRPQIEFSRISTVKSIWTLVPARLTTRVSSLRYPYIDL